MKARREVLGLERVGPAGLSELKARYSISLADAWIAAAALLEQANLVHQDPGFEVIVVPQRNGLGEG